MRTANEHEIENFKKEFCKNDKVRIEMDKYFEVEVESFEELLPGKTVISYATGEREIKDSFIMFCVSDENKDIQYYPVFSETVGRKMLNSWGKRIPKKRSIFLEESNSRHGANTMTGGTNHNADNADLRTLILFVRSLMVLHIDEPKPMNGVLKALYEKLDAHPYWKVMAGEIKSVNTALKNYLQKSVNSRHENFSNLQDYIQYVKSHAAGKRLRNTSFDTLRDIMKMSYPTEQIYF